MSLKLIKKATTAQSPVLCLLHVRNEIMRIAFTLDHHRALGVTEFLVVDNLSTDGTREYLETQADVALISSSLSFSQTGCGYDTVNALLDRFGDNRWCLVVDADEHFVYPDCETRKFDILIKYLDSHGFDSLFTLMIDMYSEKCVAETTVVEGASLLQTCDQFDRAPYRRIHTSTFPFLEIHGGPRMRLFWDSNDKFHPPTISKVPLVKWKRGYRYISATHYLKPAPSKIADVSGALLHFKYLSDFHDRVKIEVERKQHFAGAREYQKYLEKLESEPSLTMAFEGSAVYTHSSDLSRAGLCSNPSSWAGFTAR